MMKYIVTMLSFLLISYAVNCQSITLDNTGKVSKIQSGNVAVGSTVQFTGPLPGELFRNIALDSCKKKLGRKLDSLAQNLGNQSNTYWYFIFYGRLWGQTDTKEVLEEFKWIRTVLDGSLPDTTLKHLQPFYKHLKEFFEVPAKEWLQVNNTVLAGPSYKILPADVAEDGAAYKLEIKINLLYNHFIEKLFTETYSNAAGTAGIRNMSRTDYEGERKKLGEIKDEVVGLAKLDLKTIKEADVTKMDALMTSFDNLKISKAIKAAPFFKNWLWWREGELTLNPFEYRYRDLNKTNPGELFAAAQNKSILDSLTRKQFNLQAVFMVTNNNKFRTIQYLQQENGKGDQVSTLVKPLRSSENVQVVVHNVNAGETTDLVLIKSTPHNGMNNTLNMLDSALGTLGVSLGSLTQNSTVLTTLLNALGGNNKSVGDDPEIIRAHPRATKWAPVPKGKMDTAWNRLKADLEEQGVYYTIVMERTKASAAANTLKQVIDNNNKSDYLRAMIEVIKAYYEALNTIASRLDAFKIDSIVYANVYRLVFESNLPPKEISLQDDDRPFGYRTDILYTNETEEKVTQSYAVKRYWKTGDKKDSALIVSFKYKTAAKELFGVSIGPAFTIHPTDNYGKNTVTANANGSLTIVTDRKLVNFTVGLNIYPLKIFTLDNNLFHSVPHLSMKGSPSTLVSASRKHWITSIRAFRTISSQVLRSLVAFIVTCTTGTVL
jgi:hypothetical protein